MLVVGLGNSTLELCRGLRKDEENFICILDGPDDLTEKDPEKIEEKFDPESLNRHPVTTNDSGVCLLIVESSSLHAAVTLRVLEELIERHSYKVHVLLLRDKVGLSTKSQKLLDRVVFGVLQQKARSTAIQNLILIDVGQLGSIISEQVSLLEYEKTLTEQIVSTVQMYFQISEKHPFYDSLNDEHETSRIMTLGYADFESGDETMLYDLQYPRDKRYYYLLTDEDMNTPGILKKIRSQITEKQEKNIDISFGVYKTTFEEKYVYFSVHSSFAYNEQEV